MGARPLHLQASRHTGEVSARRDEALQHTELVDGVPLSSDGRPVRPSRSGNGQSRLGEGRKRIPGCPGCKISLVPYIASTDGRPIVRCSLGGGGGGGGLTTGTLRTQEAAVAVTEITATQ